MTTEIKFIDRDEAVALQREAENESAIDQLVKQINKAREELRLSEQTLAAIQESLSGKVKE